MSAFRKGGKLISTIKSAGVLRRRQRKGERGADLEDVVDVHPVELERKGSIRWEGNERIPKTTISGINYFDSVVTLAMMYRGPKRSTKDDEAKMGEKMQLRFNGLPSDQNGV